MIQVHQGFLVLTLIFFMDSCKKEQIEFNSLRGIHNHINFTSLQVGQKSRYIRYEFDCVNGPSSFQWTGDTLQLEVTEREGHLYFNESVTASSPLYKGGFFVDTVSYLIEQETGYLVIPQRDLSALFFFYGADRLNLRYQLYERPLLQQKECMLMLAGVPFAGDELASIHRFDLGDIHLNDKTVVSCVPTVWNLEAYLFYDQNQLFLTHSMHEIEFNSEVSILVRGWHLLDD